MAAELHRKTGGNAFFVAEALASDPGAIPDTVRDAVFARVGRLSGEGRTLLEAVAVAPPQTELWLLAAMAAGELAALDECVTAGMLVGNAKAVAFRHELARLAVEESIAPARRLELHRAALAALARAPVGSPDLARLAHHAEAAGDAAAVLRYAPAAAERASSLGAHREAAAHYARATRFADSLSPAERADLLARESQSCYPADLYDDGIAALEREVELRRAAGDRVGEGSALRRLSGFLWCPGRVAESRAASAAAVAILEQFPPSSELVEAYINECFLHAVASETAAAVEWGTRAREVAQALKLPELDLQARTLVASAIGDLVALEEALEEAHTAGRPNIAVSGFLLVGGAAIAQRRPELAERCIAAGIALSDEHSQELDRLYLLAYRARLELDRGAWDDAAATAGIVLRTRRTSTTPRIHGLVVLALVRLRRGDPDVEPLLDEAWALAEPTGELGRIWPVAAARAEAAWLAEDADAVDAATVKALALARALDDSAVLAELSVWRKRVGFDSDATAGAPPAALARARGRMARRRREVDRDRRTLRRSARARRDGRRKRLALGPRAAGRARRAPSRDRPRAPPRHARAEAHHAREPRRADPPRARGADACRRRSVEPRDRRAARPLRAHGRPPRGGRASQAAREDARRGGRACGPPRRRSLRSGVASTSISRGVRLPGFAGAQPGSQFGSPRTCGRGLEDVPVPCR